MVFITGIPEFAQSYKVFFCDLTKFF